MDYNKNFNIKLLIFLLGFLFLMFTGLILNSEDKNPSEEKKEKGAKLADIQVPPPPFSEDIFPCSECHGDLEINRQRRELDAHEDIILLHDEKNRWCLDCHDAENRDKLHLADGRLLDYDQSYILCGQCHGPKLRDWRKGVHGQRTGLWNGQKKYLLCAHCHNPHSPKFKKLKPEPAPKKER